MISTKTPKCKICGGPHYKTFCFNAPKKVIKVRAPISTNIKRKQLKPAVRKPKPISTERQTLVRDLDKVFSVYIRRKDTIGGRARCVTCGKVQPWREMDNGHYISRGKVQTRWDEMNCHVQCTYCNRNLRGNMDKYKDYIVRKYGNKILFYLKDKSVQTNKVSTVELREMLTLYKQKVKDL